MQDNIDIKENQIYSTDPALFEILLKDMTRSKDGEIHNIMWATDNYESRGLGYQETDEILPELVTGSNGMVLQPRVNKSKEEQELRSREKAEVFTPAWICNKQNNLIDSAWFGCDSPFNKESDAGWETKQDKILFPAGKTWEDYIRDTRLEITCGEAPYLVSRYDVVAGKEIPISDRIGLLDRKLRVVSENTELESDWYKWAIVAFQNIYGYEWQGDNLLLAREALLYTFQDYYREKFEKEPSLTKLKKIAEIISWNLWQMDGLKGVIPYSCHDEVREESDLFGEISKTVTRCQGCEKNDILKHNGVYCYIKDWEKRKQVRFVDLLKN